MVTHVDESPLQETPWATARTTASPDSQHHPTCFYCPLVSRRPVTSISALQFCRTFSILSSQPCILARSGRVSCCTKPILMWPTAFHMLHHPSYCPGPTPHDFHAFALMDLRFRSRVSMLQWCNGLSSYPGSSLQRGPFS
jgi:hypothetical protein